MRSIPTRWHRRWLTLLASGVLVASVGLQSASAAKPIPQVTFVDYAQCVDGTGNDAATDCPDGWINGILQASNSTYHEDEVTPQRAEVLVPAGATLSHSVTFTYQARKGSAGVHAYDSLATWNYTQTDADKDQGLNAADVVIGAAKTALIPADSTVIAPFTSASGATSDHELGDENRQMTVYGLQAGSTLSVSAPVHDCTTAVPNVCGDPTKDDYASITVTYTLTDTTAARKIQFLFGGHLGSSKGPRGWGTGLGASNISGGPYHIKWTASDGASIGNRDNQIMGSAIIFNDTGLTTQVKNNADNTSIANNAHVSIPTTVYDTATISNPTATAGGTVAYYYEEGDNTCSIAGATSLGTKTVTNGVVPNSDTATLSSTGTYYFWAVYSGDPNNGASSSGCDTEIVVVDQNTPTVSTQVKDNADDTDVANNAHISIGDVLYDTASLTGETSDAGGTISYGLFSDSACTTLVDDLTPATADVTNGSVPDSDTHTFNSAGTFYFQATYSGDGNNFGPVSSGCDTEIVVVDQNTPGISTAQNLLPNDDAILTGLTSNAGGSVLFELFAPGDNVCAGPAFYSQTVPVSGNGTYSTTNTTVFASDEGTYRWKVYYSGDANNEDATSACGVEFFTIDNG